MNYELLSELILAALVLLIAVDNYIIKKRIEKIIDVSEHNFEIVKYKHNNLVKDFMNQKEKKENE